MDIRQVVHITLADEPPKIIDGYWHEWVNGEWINTGVKAEAKDGSNYLILGFFSDKIQYKLSPAGIPVVKRSDDTQGNFSAYELTAPQSTFNHTTKKGTFVSSEWKLVENVDFIYMQEAYIERLQASLVTAEKIEALKIVTSNLEVISGAKIAGFEIVGDVLKSDFSREASFEGNNYQGDFTWTELATGSVSLSPSSVGITEGLEVTFDNGENGKFYKEYFQDSQGVKITQTISSDNGFVHEQTMEVRIDGIYKDGRKIL